MKMKSKFFGLNAKLALAILAVGSLFTSCYDTENGDVTVPYKAPDAVYSFVGTVTNDVTGQAVSGASVTISGGTISGSATTDSNGGYQIVVKKDQTGSGKFAGGTVTVSIAGTSNYDAASASISAEAVANGQAITYYKNIVVNYTTYIPEGLKVSSSATTSSHVFVYSGEDETADNYVENLDIINDTDDPLQVTKSVTVSKGAMVTGDSENIYGYATAPMVIGNSGNIYGAKTRATDDVLTAIKDYIKADLGGTDPTPTFDSETLTYTFVLAPKTALKNLTVSYTYETKNYTFTYADTTYSIVVKRVVSVAFSNTQVTTENYHGHGHGHGHGGDLNAGGGIFE
ncbi:MAG: hypothetical protein LKI29_08415 [Bacteroides sp.]|jgi:hypothetical protein|nr:hypothetical protein [Bacteroides sp.]